MDQQTMHATAPPASHRSRPLGQAAAVAPRLPPLHLPLPRPLALLLPPPLPLALKYKSK